MTLRPSIDHPAVPRSRSRVRPRIGGPLTLSADRPAGPDRPASTTGLGHQHRAPGVCTALVALTGPSCVGKHTIAGLLPADQVQVLDLQMFARARADARSAAGRAIAGVPSARAYPVAAVDALLRDALVHGVAPARGRTVVLPGLPASVAQVQLLAGFTRVLGIPGAVVELGAFNRSLLGRRTRRRVCLTCTPDPCGAPQTVAPPADDRYINPVSDSGPRNTCTTATCGARLYVRTRDDLPAFGRRVHACRDMAPTLRRTASASGLGWYGINTSGKETYGPDGDLEGDDMADTRTRVAADVVKALAAASLLPTADGSGATTDGAASTAGAAR